MIFNTMPKDKFKIASDLFLKAVTTTPLIPFFSIY